MDLEGAFSSSQGSSIGWLWTKTPRYTFRASQKACQRPSRRRGPEAFGGRPRARALADDPTPFRSEGWVPFGSFGVSHHGRLSFQQGKTSMPWILAVSSQQRQPNFTFEKAPHFLVCLPCAGSSTYHEFSGPGQPDLIVCVPIDAQSRISATNEAAAEIRRIGSGFVRRPSPSRATTSASSLRACSAPVVQRRIASAADIRSGCSRSCNHRSSQLMTCLAG